jgi:hypothetical protein
MDDDFSSLEKELIRLQPTRPSANVERQLESELSTTATPRSRMSWWPAAIALPIAAAIALAVFTARRATPSVIANVSAEKSADKDALKPVTAENVLYAATDEGMVTLANGIPAHRERLKFVDTITWQNPTTRASLTWTVPREEVRVVPVRYQ